MGMTTQTDLYDFDHDEDDVSADLADFPGAYPEGYCDYCEREGHTFSACPARDDEYGEGI